MLKIRYKNPTTRYTVRDVDGATFRGFYNDGTRWNGTTGFTKGFYPESFQFVSPLAQDALVDIFSPDHWMLHEYHRVDEITDPDKVTVAWMYYSLNGDTAIRLWNDARTSLTEAQTPITRADAKRLGDSLNVDWSKVDLDQFHAGIGVELEHTDVTGGDLTATAKIALAHLRELPDYYTKLRKMEQS